ncbi:MAG: cell division protein SepF [Bacilli bacterium]|nr:cell division protein SepF [Bacilli bacterium]
MGLFSKKNKEEIKGQGPILQSKDEIVFYRVNTNSDDEIFTICDYLLKDKPVLANFDSLVAQDCNHMLSFISGCVYALSGNLFTMNERLFLFASGKALEDGSVEKWVNENKD